MKDTKVMNGGYVLGANGLPFLVQGKELLLQLARLRLCLRKGKFPYSQEAGSKLWALDLNGEHSRERALALANEALLDLAGVQAESAEISGGKIIFRIVTPLGEGEVEYGEIQGDTGTDAGGL